jgi:hypothetical protein
MESKGTDLRLAIGASVVDLSPTALTPHYLTCEKGRLMVGRDFRDPHIVGFFTRLTDGWYFRTEKLASVKQLRLAGKPVTGKTTPIPATTIDVSWNGGFWSWSVVNKVGAIVGVVSAVVTIIAVLLVKA